MSGDPSGADGAENRGQVGLTTAQQNARANAQERGSREVSNMSSGVQTSRDFGYSEPQAVEDGDFSIGDQSGESFVTSKQGALNDLNNRMGVGQMPGFNNPFIPGANLVYAANEFGKTRAQDIQNRINNGGTPVFDSMGRIQGVVSKQTSQLFGDYNSYTGASNYDPTITGKQPSSGVSGNGYQMTANDVRNTEMKLGGGEQGGDGGYMQAATVDPLAAARQRRAAALGGKQNSLAEAFGVFNDDFYGDLGSSYSDFQNPLLTQGYDASLRGIYDGFKAKGLLKQSEVDAAIAGLDTSRAAEMERIGQSASEYTQAKRDEVAKRQSALGDQLASMVGGATTAAEVDAQTAAINSFDFSKDIDKLKTPGAKGGLNFFQNYNQVAAQADPSVNVAAQSTTGAPQTGSITPVNNTGIASPFGSNSIRVV